MLQQMKKRLKNEKGLTLIELLAVIVILAIIAAIAIPAIGNIIDNSRIKAIKSDAVNIINAANLYYTDNGKNAELFTQDNTEAQDYIADPGSFEEYSVDANLRFTGSVTVSGVTVDIDGATIAEIEPDTAESGTNIEVTN